MTHIHSIFLLSKKIIHLYANFWDWNRVHLSLYMFIVRAYSLSRDHFFSISNIKVLKFLK